MRAVDWYLLVVLIDCLTSVFPGNEAGVRIRIRHTRIFGAIEVTVGIVWLLAVSL